MLEHGAKESGNRSKDQGIAHFLTHGLGKKEQRFLAAKVNEKTTCSFSHQGPALDTQEPHEQWRSEPKTRWENGTRIRQTPQRQTPGGPTAPQKEAGVPTHRLQQKEAGSPTTLGYNKRKQGSTTLG